MSPYNLDKLVIHYLGVEEDGEENSLVFGTTICSDVITR